jgi:hypothetical protein
MTYSKPPRSINTPYSTGTRGKMCVEETKKIALTA